MENTSERLNWRVVIPILLFVIFNSAFNAFSSVIAEIAKVFPDSPPTLIQTILTIPSLISIPVSLLSGILASYITKKQLVVFALSCELAGGLVPVFAHNTIYALFVSSTLIGIGQGFLISVGGAIVAQNFSGVHRGTVMGFKQAASSIGIAGFTILTGYLSTSGWYKAYFVYLLVIPVIVLTIILLPKGQKDVKLVGKGVGLSGLVKVFTPGMIYLCIMCFFLGLFNFAFYLNIGMSITTKGLGDSSAIGMATSFNPVLTIVIGVLFGGLIRMTKKFTLALAMIILAVAYFLLTSAQSLTVIAIGGAIFGIGAGIQQASSIYYIMESVEKNASALAIAIAVTFISLGVSSSPIIVNSIAGLFGDVNGTSGLMIAAVAYLIMFGIECLREAFFNRNSQIGIVQKNTETKVTESYMERKEESV
ncbi:MAG: MFS transporter [Treponema sp.]|jgi:MFS family permease|nr:MFS transporter [Treponema sp.]